MSPSRISLALVVLMVVAPSLGRPTADRIPEWPGYVGPPATFEMYGGYLSTAPVGDSHLYYIFTESSGNATTDPVVLWLNGGPGCSSLYGFGRELGPFVFEGELEASFGKKKDYDGRVPTWESNPYSWNKRANMIFLESPAGVGFSFSESDDFQYTDEKTAKEAYQALLTFFEKFPEFQGRDFYISGESYAGIYVPMLADAVHEGNLAGNPHINLKGFLVGNGIMDRVHDGNSFVPFAFGNGLISEKLYDDLEETCDGNFVDPPNAACSALQLAMNVQIGNVNRYDIYRDCTPTPTTTHWEDPEWRNEVLANIPCIDTTLDNEFYNDPEVRASLHVDPSIPTWVVCSNRLRYSKTVRSVLDIYLKLVQHYRILVYTGDTDLAVTPLGTQRSVVALGLEELDSWHAWYINGQVQGYATKYENLDFVTIAGVGHMVPEWNRPAGYELLRKFIDEEDF